MCRWCCGWMYWRVGLRLELSAVRVRIVITVGRRHYHLRTPDRVICLAQRYYYGTLVLWYFWYFCTLILWYIGTDSFNSHRYWYGTLVLSYFCNTLVYSNFSCKCDNFVLLYYCSGYFAILVLWQAQVLLWHYIELWYRVICPAGRSPQLLIFKWTPLSLSLSLSALAELSIFEKMCKTPSEGKTDLVFSNHTSCKKKAQISPPIFC